MESESFYKEANDMQSGWGNYLYKIDRLRDKVDNDIPINAREACWVLYGESIGNGGHRDSFLKWAEGEMPGKTFTWEIWKSLFYGWFSCYKKE